MACLLIESILNGLTTNEIIYLLSTEDGLLLNTKNSSKILVPIGYAKKNPSLFEGVSSFVGQLKESQKSVIKDIKFNSILFHLPTGFGKTILGLFFASFQKKTLILVPRQIIFNQWLKRINEFLPSKSSSEIEVRLERAFYNRLKTDKEYFYDLVIVDECHMNEKLVFTQILPYIQSTFFFGFTASPNNESLFNEHFFKQTIFRHELKTFNVFPIYLEFVPPVYFKYFDGKQSLDYNRMLSSLTENNKRLNTISDIIKGIIKKHTKKTLILAKNINTVVFLNGQLSLLFICDVMYGNKKKYNDKIEVLIGTYQKMGVGFDSFEFEILILIDNVKNIIQAEGRIRNCRFMLFDFIDNHAVFEKHWKLRKNWYLKRGAKIENRNSFQFKQ